MLGLINASILWFMLHFKTDACRCNVGASLYENGFINQFPGKSFMSKLLHIFLSTPTAHKMSERRGRMMGVALCASLLRQMGRSEIAKCVRLFLPSSSQWFNASFRQQFTCWVVWIKLSVLHNEQLFSQGARNWNQPLRISLFLSPPTRARVAKINCCRVITS